MFYQIWKSLVMGLQVVKIYPPGEQAFPGIAFQCSLIIFLAETVPSPCKLMGTYKIRRRQRFFLLISLSPLHDYNVKMLNFTF